MLAKLSFTTTYKIHEHSDANRYHDIYTKKNLSLSDLHFVKEGFLAYAWDKYTKIIC